MQIERAKVVAREEVYPNVQVLWLAAPGVTRGAGPGQFVMVRCGEGLDPLLPRAMSYYRFRVVDGERQMAILFDVRGRAGRLLAQRQSGDELMIFGPLGRGFSLRPSAHHLLLVTRSLGIAALMALIDEGLTKGRSVTLLMGARSADQLFPLHLLPPEVEVVTATDDGSTGHHGLITDLFAQYVPWADQVFACGPSYMYQEMAASLRRMGSRKPVQVLLEERMACGQGLCYACAVETRRGMKLVCKDGPRFELREVF